VAPAGAVGLAAAGAAGLAADGAAGLAAARAALGAAAASAAEAGVASTAGAVGVPVAELVSAVVAVWAAVGFSGFGAGGSVRGAPTGAADAPAPGASVRDTSPFNGSAGASLAGLSAAACGDVGGFCGSSAIYTQSRAPFCHA
jgi:hypothetical protein